MRLKLNFLSDRLTMQYCRESKWYLCVIYVSARHDVRACYRGTGVVDASVARAVARRASTDVTDAEEHFLSSLVRR